MSTLLLFWLESYGDEIALDEYAAIGKQLRRSLERIPLSTLLRELAVLAEQEKATPRHHYWESTWESRFHESKVAMAISGANRF